MLAFELPDVGEGVAEGEIIQWLVAPGDSVTEDQPVVEVETDKAVVEVPSPVDGTVAELRAAAGEVVPVGEVIIVFDEAGEETDEAATTGDTEPAGASGATGNGDTPADGRVFAAPSARRLARELGVDISAVEGSGPSGRVTEGDVRAAADGEAADTGEGTGETADPDASAAVDDGTASTRERTLAVPSTRGVARELDVDLGSVPATERRDGEAFVTAEAVREYAETQQAAQAADAAAASAAGAADADPADAERVSAGDTDEEATTPGVAERVPYRGVRRTIGEQMEQSKFTAPHVTHHDREDVTELVEMRDRSQSRAADRGVDLTYLPFVLKAVVAGLREYPILNSRLDEDAGEIVVHGDYNVGIATATDAGLMVPVVEHVDEKSILDIAAETRTLVEKARDRSIAREEMQGGTFTVTNFGAIGGEYATPVINYPETAILGLGAVRERPWVIEDDGESSVAPRHVLPLSLSIDHRVVDGAEAARFTNTVMDYLRDPELLLLE
ncbi:dihydrolipoamide acetyltransferase family protein [Halorientalis litorea]|uniref:dihydrolipoamide acetyltransferase family protein n=1 Tax=Halorientalis litorea TaxID=2931977 RepID=UPI001FF1E14E|nr:dihydrolipoamide acetyltransferase family protein [Halorientalis litorea]